MRKARYVVTTTSQDASAKSTYHCKCKTPSNARRFAFATWSDLCRYSFDHRSDLLRTLFHQDTILALDHHPQQWLGT